MIFFSLLNNILFIRFLLECFYTKPIIMLCFSCVCFNSSLFLDRSFSSIPSPKLQNKSYFRILCTTRSSHDCSSHCWLIRPFWSKTRLKTLCLFVCYLLSLMYLNNLPWLPRWVSSVPLRVFKCNTLYIKMMEYLWEINWNHTDRNNFEDSY